LWATVFMAAKHHGGAVASRVDTGNYKLLSGTCPWWDGVNKAGV
jgi:hypothetical protein